MVLADRRLTASDIVELILNESVLDEEMSKKFIPYQITQYSVDRNPSLLKKTKRTNFNFI